MGRITPLKMLSGKNLTKGDRQVVREVNGGLSR